MEKDETTIGEVMEFLQENVVTKDDLRDSQNELKTELRKEIGTDLNSGLNSLKLELLDSMDEKIADLKGDLTVMMRNEDKKLVSLINLPKDKEIITD